MSNKIKIVKIISEEFAVSPEEKAARRLHKIGVTSDQVYTLNGVCIPDPQKISVANKLRDIELGILKIK
jgi:hypothetical protein